jgi:hypothetical protein
MASIKIESDKTSPTSPAKVEQNTSDNKTVLRLQTTMIQIKLDGQTQTNMEMKDVSLK